MESRGKFPPLLPTCSEKTWAHAGSFLGIPGRSGRVPKMESLCSPENVGAIQVSWEKGTRAPKRAEQPPAGHGQGTAVRH